MDLLHIICLAVLALAVASDGTDVCHLTSEVFFDIFDPDMNGGITVDETDELFETVDDDNSGDVSKFELRLFILGHFPQLLNCADDIWKFLDFNGDNIVSDFNLDDLDGNGDGSITPDEFYGL